MTPEEVRRILDPERRRQAQGKAPSSASGTEGEPVSEVEKAAPLLQALLDEGFSVAIDRGPNLFDEVRGEWPGEYSVTLAGEVHGQDDSLYEALRKAQETWRQR